MKLQNDSRVKSGLGYRWPRVLAAGVIFTFLFCSYCAFCAGEGDFAPEEGARIQLQTGGITTIAVSQLSKVAVGDPNIADVKILSQQEILVMAKVAGITNLIIWDERGQSVYNVEVSSKAATDAADTIRGLLAERDIQGISVRPVEGKVYLSGHVKTQERMKEITDLTGPFQSMIVNVITFKEAQPMVKVEIEVLEINRDDEKRLGIDWSGAQTIVGTEGTPAATGRMREIFKLADIQRGAFQLTVNALISEGKVRLLARPNLVTLNGQSAKFLVGGEIPITVQQNVDEPPTVEWKEYGITLSVTPKVSEGQEAIIIELGAEVSELGSRTFVYAGNEIPEILTRNLQAQVKLKQGQTLLMAGMFRDKDTVTTNRVPLLSKIPILGKIFTYESFEREKKELVIALTPTIIPTEPADEAPVAEPAAEAMQIDREQSAPPLDNELKSELTQYVTEVQRRVAENIIYPQSFWRAKREGIAEVTLCIAKDGQLKTAEITASSGFKELDLAALNAANKQKSYPPLPSGYAEEVLYLTIPVSYEN